VISLRRDMKRKEPNYLVHTCQEVRTELCLGYTHLYNVFKTSTYNFFELICMHSVACRAVIKDGYL